MLYAFFLLACTVLVCRHIVADMRQEQRIEVLENLVKTLLSKDYNDNDDYNDNSFADNNNSAGKNTTKKTNTFAGRNERKTIAEEDVIVKPKSTSKEGIITMPEESRIKPHKFTQPIRIELNTADSSTLVKIPGIGAKSAAMIVRYRELLGGFHSVRQLEEKLTWDGANEHMDEWCKLWLTADSSLIKPLNVNTAEFREILRHPYIDYEQTKALVNYRDKHRRIDGFEALEMMEVFSEQDIQKLRFYLIFDEF